MEQLPAKTQSAIKSVKGYLADNSTAQQLARILPKHLTADRMMRVALTAVNKNPKLGEADVSSFAFAMLAASTMGLEPDGRNGHLVPFNNNKKGIIEVVFIPDYKGLVQLILNSGLAQSIHADVVCEGDVFKHDKGKVLEHTYDLRKPRGDVYGAYCIAELKGGSEKHDIMSRHDIEAIRARSKSANAGPWVTDWNEQAKKTVFKRCSKWLPMSSELQSAIFSEDRDAIEVSASVVDTSASQPQIEDTPRESIVMKSPSPEPEAQPAARRTRKAAPAPVVDVEADTEPPLDQSSEPAKESPKPASGDAGPGDDQLNELSEKQELVAIFLVNDCEASWALLKQTAADMKWDKSLPSLLNGKGFGDLSDEDCDKILKAKRGLKAAIDKTRKPTE